MPKPKQINQRVVWDRVMIDEAFTALPGAETEEQCNNWSNPAVKHRYCMKIGYSYTRSYRDRHGKLRSEFRRRGRIVPIRATSGTAEFQAAYDAAGASIGHDASHPTIWQALNVQ